MAIIEAHTPKTTMEQRRQMANKPMDVVNGGKKVVLQVPTPVHDVRTADRQTPWYSHFKNDFDFIMVKIKSIFYQYGYVHPCPIGHIDDNFQGKSVTEYIGMFRPDSEDCAEIARKCEAGTFYNASIRLLEKTIFASDRIGLLRLVREEGLAPTTPTPPKMSWIMSNVVGDGSFPHDFMNRDKELNRETFNEVVIPFLIRHHESCHSGVCTLNILLVGKLLVIIILK